jgi:aquaporin Z
MEAAELCVLMFFICLFAALLYGRPSPFQNLNLVPAARPFLMGFGVAFVTFLIIRSPFGRRTGAHFNPAVTLTYFYLGRVHRWDALFYIAWQFTGALSGVYIAHTVLGDNLAHPPVSFVVTVPGAYGDAAAFLAEFLLAGLLMAIVLFATNHRILVRFSPFAVAGLTVFYYGFCASLSGFSVNPARSFSSALFASIWNGMWIYFAAPVCGMLAAAAVYARAMSERVYCAKIFHDTESPCPFFCRFPELFREGK